MSQSIILGDDVWLCYPLPLLTLRPSVLSVPPSDAALLNELPITFSSQCLQGFWGSSLVPSPTTTTHTQLKQGHLPCLWVSLASVSALLPPFPFPSLPLPPAASHPFAFVEGEGVTLGSQCRGANWSTPVSSPSCCCGVCSPACAQHAALVSSHSALHHVHCSLTTFICKTAFSHWILTLSLFFFSLSVSLMFFSHHSPTAHTR